MTLCKGESLVFYGATLLHTTVQTSYPTSASGSFKATLIVVETNALPFLVPCLLAHSRGLKTNPFVCRVVADMASSPGQARRCRKT